MLKGANVNDLIDENARLRQELAEAKGAGRRLYSYLKEALNSWLPMLAEEADCDEEEQDDAIVHLSGLLAETSKPLGIDE